MTEWFFHSVYLRNDKLSFWCHWCSAQSPRLRLVWFKRCSLQLRRTNGRVKLSWLNSWKNNKTGKMRNDWHKTKEKVWITPLNYRDCLNYPPEPQNRTFFTPNYANRTNYPSTQSAVVLVYVAVQLAFYFFNGGTHVSDSTFSLPLSLSSSVSGAHVGGQHAWRGAGKGDG